MDKNLFDKGLAIRKEVLGAEYVENSLSKATDFTMAFQEFVTSFCWGEVWGRPGLDRKTRSMLNLAMLSALGKPQELRLHVRGAINNGVSKEEIKEIFLQVGVYCGVPASLEAFKVAQEVFTEMDV